MDNKTLIPFSNANGQCIQLFQFTLSDQSFKRTRLELILGFRGCRREMDMEAENTISIALRVLTKSNKDRYDSYCLKAVPLFETVKGLKEYLVQRSGEELKSATTGEDFTLD